MKRIGKNTIALAAAGLLTLLPAACRRQEPPPPPDSQRLPSSPVPPRPPAIRSAAIGEARPIPVFAPPPPTRPPRVPADATPTRFAGARPGMEVVQRLTHPGSPEVIRTTRVIGVDRQNVDALQTTRTQTGEYAYRVSFNRYRISEPGSDPPEKKEKFTGLTLQKVSGKHILCEVYEYREGNISFRTLRCPDLFGEVVRHEDDAAGEWETRVEMIDFTE